MRIYFMRHGQTNYNVLGLCNDNPARDVFLTDTGRQQAHDAAHQLAQARIEHIFVSELARTRQTADIINRHHCAPVSTHPALNDWRTGLDGEPVSALYAAIAADPLNTRINNGETLLEHKQRVLTFIRWLRKRKEQTVLVVAHEETMRVANAWFHGLDDDAMLTHHFANTHILEFSA